MTTRAQEHFHMRVMPLAHQLLLRRVGTDRDVGTHTVATCFRVAELFYEVCEQKAAEAKEKDEA